MADKKDLKKDYKKAIESYSQSLELQNNVLKTYVDRSIAYTMMGDSVNALKDFVIAYRLNPESEKIFADSVFNFVQRKQYDLAINEYNMLLKFNTSNPFYYFYRGVAQFSKNNVDAAIADWEIAVKFKSKDVLQSASYNLSVAYDAIGNENKAVYYALMAKTVGYAVADTFIASLQKKQLEQSKK